MWMSRRWVFWAFTRAFVRVEIDFNASSSRVHTRDERCEESKTNIVGGLENQSEIFKRSLIVTNESSRGHSKVVSCIFSFCCVPVHHH